MLLFVAAPLAAFVASESPAAGPDLHPDAFVRAGAQRRMAKAGYFESRWKAGPQARAGK